MKSRWFRFSLRTLLLLITALCVWLGIQVNAARRQREAVAAILKAGGEVWFDYHSTPDPAVPGSTFNRNASPPGPAWLRRILGEDYFRTANCVIFMKQTITESDLAQVAQLPKLICVNLGDTQIVEKNTGTKRPIQDSDLIVVERLTLLRDLVLNDDNGHGRITDAGLKRIQNLTNLDELYLRNNQISDAGLQWLKGFTKLLTLDLGGTKVTADGIRGLAKSLPNTRIDSDVPAWLRR